MMQMFTAMWAVCITPGSTTALEGPRTAASTEPRNAPTTSTARDTVPTTGDAFILRPFDPLDLVGKNGSGEILETTGQERLVYIPADLDEALHLLETKLSREVLDDILKSDAEDHMGIYHFSLGLSLRNGWGLWNDSRLARFFESNSIHHADDMSGIILDSLWRDLHGKPIELNKQIKHYQEFWKEQGVKWDEATSAPR